MSKFNTADTRDEIRRQQNKPWYVKCPWFEKELVKTLDEIDRLTKKPEKSRYMQGYIKGQDNQIAHEKLHLTEAEQIEQRTKEAIWASINLAHAHKAHTMKRAAPLRMVEIQQAIDSVGGR